MSIYAENKLIHYNLNQDYPYPDFGLSFEDQTNVLINKIINKFIIEYQKDFGKKSFVYEFNDDLPSMVGYRILQAIMAIKTDFNFKLFGRPKKTKKMIVKGQKICSKRELKRNQDIILISNFNSIYKVINKPNSSNILVSPKYYLIKDFTYREFKIAQIFYHIGYIKDDFDINIDCEKFFAWEANLKEKRPLINDKGLHGGPPKISLVWLDDTENDLSILQNIEQSDNMIFYYYNMDKKPKYLLNNFFALLLKRTTNRPTSQYMNINEYNLPAQISIRYKIATEYLGNWPEDKKQQFEDNCNNVRKERSHELMEMVDKRVDKQLLDFYREHFQKEGN